MAADSEGQADQVLAQGRLVEGRRLQPRWVVASAFGNQIEGAPLGDVTRLVNRKRLRPPVMSQQGERREADDQGTVPGSSGRRAGLSGRVLGEAGA